MENKKTSSMYFKERHALLVVECFRETGHFVVDVLNDAPSGNSSLVSIESY